MATHEKKRKWMKGKDTKKTLQKRRQLIRIKEEPPEKHIQ